MTVMSTGLGGKHREHVLYAYFCWHRDWWRDFRSFWAWSSSWELYCLSLFLYVSCKMLATVKRLGKIRVRSLKIVMWLTHGSIYSFSHNFIWLGHWFLLICDCAYFSLPQNSSWVGDCISIEISATDSWDQIPLTTFWQLTIQSHWDIISILYVLSIKVAGVIFILGYWDRQ
jgi:hypothetical protein